MENIFSSIAETHTTLTHIILCDSAYTTGKVDQSSALLSPSAPPNRCSACSTQNSPLWRRGPKGPKSLCNACGVKWAKGKLSLKMDNVATNLQVLKHKKMALAHSRVNHEKRSVPFTTSEEDEERNEEEQTEPFTYQLMSNDYSRYVHSDSSGYMDDFDQREMRRGMRQKSKTSHRARATNDESSDNNSDAASDVDRHDLDNQHVDGDYIDDEHSDDLELKFFTLQTVMPDIVRRALGSFDNSWALADFAELKESIDSLIDDTKKRASLLKQEIKKLDKRQGSSEPVQDERSTRAKTRDNSKQKRARDDPPLDRGRSRRGEANNTHNPNKKSRAIEITTPQDENDSHVNGVKRAKRKEESTSRRISILLFAAAAIERAEMDNSALEDIKPPLDTDKLNPLPAPNHAQQPTTQQQQQQQQQLQTQMNKPNNEPQTLLPPVSAMTGGALQMQTSRESASFANNSAMAPVSTSAPSATQSIPNKAQSSPTLQAMAPPTPSSNAPSSNSPQYHQNYQHQPQPQLQHQHHTMSNPMLPPTTTLPNFHSQVIPQMMTPNTPNNTPLYSPQNSSKPPSPASTPPTQPSRLATPPPSTMLLPPPQTQPSASAGGSNTMQRTMTMTPPVTMPRPGPSAGPSPPMNFNSPLFPQQGGSSPVAAGNTAAPSSPAPLLPPTNMPPSQGQSLHPLLANPMSAFPHTFPMHIYASGDPAGHSHPHAHPHGTISPLHQVSPMASLPSIPTLQPSSNQNNGSLRPMQRPL